LHCRQQRSVERYLLAAAALQIVPGPRDITRIRRINLAIRFWMSPETVECGSDDAFAHLW